LFKIPVLDYTVYNVISNLILQEPISQFNCSEYIFKYAIGVYEELEVLRSKGQGHQLQCNLGLKYYGGQYND